VFFKQYWNAGVVATESTFRLGVTSDLRAARRDMAPVLGAIADREQLARAHADGWSRCSAVPRPPDLRWWARVTGSRPPRSIWSRRSASGRHRLQRLAAAARREPRSTTSSRLRLRDGYLGGGLLFALNVLMTLKPQWFGLADASAAVRVSFVMVGVWWFVFALPSAFLVANASRRRARPPTEAIRLGLRELGQTIRELRRYRPIVWFLAAYWLYIDGVNTVIKMAVDYGLSLGFAASNLVAALLLTQFVAFGSPRVRLARRRIGARKGIFIALSVYVGATVYAYFLEGVRDFFVLASSWDWCRAASSR